MTATYQTDGVIADVTASQGTGALSTGIGVGENSSGPTPIFFADTSTDFVAGRIGGSSLVANGVVKALGAAYGSSKGTRYLTAAGAVAVDAAVSPSTYLNRSGRALVLGDHVWAVAP